MRLKAIVISIVACAFLIAGCSAAAPGVQGAHDDTIGNSTIVNGSLVGAPDTVGTPQPPAGITSLHNTTWQQHSITWTWTDPSSADLDTVMVYVDGVFTTNVSAGTQTYTASSLTAGTQYTLATRTAGNAGLINLTWVNSTALTAPITTTPPVADVTVNQTTGVPPLTDRFTGASTGTPPARTYTVETAGDQTFTGTITDHPGNDQTVERSAEPVLPTVITVNLSDGWNLFSSPILLDAHSSSWEQIFTETERQQITLLLGWDGAWFIPDPSGPVRPLDAFYVKVNGSAHAELMPSQEISSPPARDLAEGINLVGPAPAYLNDGFAGMPLNQAFISIDQAPGGKTGYVMVISPGLNQPGWGYARGGAMRDILPFKGYWVVMENPDTMYGFSTTPVASDEDQVRAAAFRAALEANGYIVRSGGMTPIDPIVDLLDSGFGDSANGNNAGQPYKVLMVPVSPFGKEDPDLGGLTVFRIRPDEAVVYLGPTPPECDYFSFTVFLWVRHKDSLVRKGDWMVAAVNDPLNSALIRTEGNGTPFRKQTIVIFTPDRGVYERVAALAEEAGYPTSMINPYVIPSGLLNLGVFPDTPLADSFVVLMRTANFASKAEGAQYLSDDHYARVWRVTPDVAPVPDPFPTPDLRVRTWKSESELYPDLNNGLERLKNAILAKTPHTRNVSYESIRWFAESRDVLEETDPGSPLYHKFVAGEASDTPYLRTSLSGEAASFTLGNDDMVVVYGVNHAATGLATYSSFGVYGDWVTSSCQDDPWQYVFGCGDRSWNGVVSMTNHGFAGSAEEYIPGDPMAPYLYAVKVLRQPPEDRQDPYYVVVPTGAPEHPCPSPGYCLGLDDPIIIGYRAYLNPATASGADYDDIIHDRAIWFRLRD